MSRRDHSNEPERRPPVPCDPKAIPAARSETALSPSVFVPAPEQAERHRRWPWFVLGFNSVVIIAAVAVMVAWPRLRPRTLDPAERVAENYLKALAAQDNEAIHRLGTVDEPPAIRSSRDIRRDRRSDRTLKGSFAPLGAFHKKVDAEYEFDQGAGRFKTKNPLGPAGDTLDALQEMKDEAEKSGLAKKIESGSPDDLFDAAEQYAKVFTKFADSVLPTKRILPTYKMLVESAKPPLPADAKSLALEVANALPDWNALLKRPFHTLKADGPFIYERAVVTAKATDRLASLGDPPTTLRLTLARFRLEGIDTGWRVVSARRVIPGVPEPGDEAAQVDSTPTLKTGPPGGPRRSLTEAPPPQ